MSVPLPFKVYQTLAPVLGGPDGKARKIRFNKLINLFARYFGCQVERRRHNVFKITPPGVGHGTWVWPQISIFLRMPANGYLPREDLSVVGNILQEAYEWDKHTFVPRTST